MRIFVTGGTGRIGKVLVEKLLAKRYSVTLLSRSREKAVELFGKKVKVLEGDLLNVDEEKLVGVLKSCNVVMHLAALLDFKASRKEVFRQNVDATRRLVEAAQKARIKKFVFMSSCALYHGLHGVLDEKTTPKPFGAYGKSKLEAERIVKESGLYYVIIRAPAVYGPGFDDGFSTVIKLVCKGRMPVVGSGKNHVALVHVEDLVDALVLALNRKVKNDDFIITDGGSVTQEEALREVARAFGGRTAGRIPKWFAFLLAHLNALASIVGVKRVLLPEYVEMLAEDRAFNILKARVVLGYLPKYDLRKGLRTLVKTDNA